MSALTDLLLQGPSSAAELRSSLAVSQATFSRLVSAHQDVIQFGKARATRLFGLFAASRPFPSGRSMHKDRPLSLAFFIRVGLRGVAWLRLIQVNGNGLTACHGI
ncbi:transcriptional regulator [Salmonella enterica subsp. enterica serovar Gallinarum]|nr:transcriptional regulator [Salmonella enterica subsp. enterica serovar Gallinarum]